MIWILLLPLLWKGTLTGAAVANDGTLNQIFAPLPANAGSDFDSFVSRFLNVDLGFVRVGDIIYGRKTLCGEEAESVRDGAVQLTARGHFACRKEAAAQALNSFYVDNLGKCFGSNTRVEGEGGTCFFNQLVVYSSGTPQVNCDDDPSPDVRNLEVGDFDETATTFVVTFEPVCPGAFSYGLRVNGFTLFNDALVSGKRVRGDFSLGLCRTIEFSIQPYDEEGNYVGEPIFAPPVTTPGDCSRIDETEQDF